MFKKINSDRRSRRIPFVTGLLLVVLPLSLFAFNFSSFNQPSQVEAAPSTQLNFQARLSGSSGNLVPDGNYSIQFKIYNVSTGGTALWTETQATTRVVNGYLSVQLGSATAFPTTINWDQEHWLTMNVNADGEMNPRLKLTAVPYAFQAGSIAQTDGSGNRGTLKFNTVATNPNLTLPDVATGTLCVQGASACGFATGSGAAFVQGGNDFAGNAVLGTNGAGQSLLFETAGITRLTLDTSGNATLTGDYTIQGGDLLTNQTTFKLVNTTATTLNIGGAATSLTIGATTGTLTVRNATTALTGDLRVNGGDITTAAGALTVTPAAGSNFNVNLSTTGDFRVNTDQLYVDTSTGNVGVGTATPGEKLQVAGNVLASDYLYGDGASAQRRYYQTRALPTTVNNYVEIGSFNLSSGAHSLAVSVAVSNSGFSVAKQYNIPTQFVTAGNTTWYDVLPINSTGSYSGQDFALEVNQNGQVATLRLRRTTGTTVGTALVNIQQLGSTADTFTALSGTGISASNAFYAATALTQVGGNVGIGTDNPTATLTVGNTGVSTGTVRISSNTTNRLDLDGDGTINAVSTLLKLQQNGVTGLTIRSDGTPSTFSGRVIGADAVNNDEFATLGQVNSLGAGNYINNTTTLQTNSNFAIQSLADGNVTALIRARASQTADLLQFQNSAGTAALSGFNSAGNLYYRDAASGFVATLGLAGLSADRSILLPNVGGTICTTAGNCVGNGGAGDIFNGGQAGPITIGTDDNTTFTLETSNTPRITILGGGNVGIGVPNPTQKLHVQGNGLFDAVFAPGGLVAGSSSIFASGTALQAQARAGLEDRSVAVLRGGTGQTGALLQLQNSGGGSLSGFNAAGQLFFNNSGFTGTLASGTLSAIQTYTLPNASGTVCLDSNNCNYQAAGSYQSPLTFSNGLAESSGAVKLGGTLTGATDIANGGFNFSISGTGNVGIGTTAPGTKLVVQDASPVVAIRDSTTAIGAVGQEFGSLNFDSADPSTGGTAGRIVSIAETSNGAYTGLGFYTYRQGGDLLAERLRISSQGYVGIGTTNPGQELDVTGDIRASGTFIAATGTESSPAYSFNGNASTGIFQPSTNRLAISTAGAERLRVGNTGNVGIGLAGTDASYKLDVAGGTGIVGQFSGRVIGGDAVNTNEFATLGQVNTATGSGTKVSSLNGLTGALSIQGNAQIGVSAVSPNISLSIQADSIGDAQLEFNTGQHLTATSAPTFGGLTLNGNLTVAAGNRAVFTNVPIIEGGVAGVTRVYRNLANYESNSGTEAGAIVIHTGVTVANNMSLVTLKGSKYAGNGAGGTGNSIDIDIYSYWDSPSWSNRGYQNKGNVSFSDVRIGTDAAGKVVIILGDTAETLSFPKLYLEKWLSSHVSGPDSDADNWSITMETDLSTYTNVTAVTDRTYLLDDPRFINVTGDTMTGLLQGTAGLTISGAAVNLNANSNFATNINTGTSTGAITLGGGASPFSINSTNFDVNTAGAVSGVTTLNTSGTITAGGDLVAQGNDISNTSGEFRVTANTGYIDLRPNDATYGVIIRQNGDTTDWANIEVEDSFVGIASNSNTAQLQVTDAGNVNIVSGALQTAGTDRLTNAGALSNITGYSQTSGNFAQTGAGTFGTGTGAVSLNGATSVTGINPFTVGTGATSLGGTLSVSGVSTLGGNLTLNGAQLTNSGSTLFSAITITDLPTGGNIGTAAATVDVATTFRLSQTTGAQTVTIPAPTNTAAGRLIYIANVGTVSFTLIASNVSPGTTATLLWNGTAWTSAGADGSAILNQKNTDQNANFRISGTGQANTGFISPFFKTADSSGGSNTATVTLQSGDANSGNNNASGAVIIKSGDAANGNNGSTGNITIDAGLKAGTGTAGNITIGTANAAALTLGRAGITTTNAGALTVSQLLTGNLGANILGAAISLNANSNFATNVNTGTSTGAITLGGGLSPFSIDSTAFDVTSLGAVSGVTTLTTSGTINSQTISAAASFTGTLNVVTGFKVGGLAPIGQYLRGDGANFVASAIQAADIPDLGASYIRNQTSLQAASNFNISGTGTAATSFSTPLVTNAGTLALQATGANSITASTNGVERLRINGSGNVQIGTTSNFYRLEVEGGLRSLTADFGRGLVLQNTTAGSISSPNLQFVDNQATPQSLFLRKSGTQLILLDTTGNSDIKFGTDGSDTYFNGGGNFGIGTPSPTRPLHVFGSAPDISQGSIAYIEGNLSSTTNSQSGQRIVTNINPASASASTVNYIGLDAVSTTGSANLANDAVIGLSGFPYIFGSANVGTAVGGQFQIQADNTSTIANVYGVNIASPFKAAGATITNNVGLRIQGQTTGTNNIGLLIDEATGTNQTNLLIGTLTQPAGTYSIYNSSPDQNYFAGNLGIGTPTPGSRLSVQGVANSYTADLFAATTAGQSFGLFVTAGTSSSDYALRVKNAANTAEYLTVRGDGNVGIGTAAPGAKLEVAGEGTGSLKVGSSGLGGNYTGVSLNGTLSSTNYNFLGSTTDSNLYINRATGGNIFFRSNNVVQVSINSSGNVGIGDATPAALLSVGNGDLFQVNSSGAIAAATGIATSGNFAQTGAGSFSTGIGTVSLNGATAVTDSNTFSVGTGATSLGGVLAVAGATTLGGQLTVDGSQFRLLENGVSPGFYGIFDIEDLTSDQTYTFNEGGVVCTDSGNCNGAGATLQTAYTSSLSGTTPEIKLDEVRASGTFDIQDANTSLGAATNLLAVRGSNASGLGSLLFGVQANGDAVASGTINAPIVAVGTASTTTGGLQFRNSSNNNVLTLQSGTTGSNLTFTLPAADGANLSCLKTDGSGVLSFGACLSGDGSTGGVTQLNTLTGAVTIRGTANQITVAAGSPYIDLSLPQDINTSSVTTFGGINLNVVNTNQALVTSDLSVGARSTYAQVISQANNATNNNSVGLLQLQNLDTASTAAVLNITQAATSGTGISFSSLTGGTSIIVANTSGTALNANTVTTGTGFLATGVSTGNGLNLGGTGFTTGNGLLFNTTANAATTGNAIDITGAAAAITQDLAGHYINVSPSRTLTAAATRTDSASLLNLARANTVNNASAIYNVSGNVATLQGNYTATAGTMNITGDILNLSSNCSGAGTCNNSGNILELSQQQATASGSVLNVTGAGTGNLASFDASNAAANGLSVDVQSASSSQYVLNLTANNGVTNVLFAGADGNVGIGTVAPASRLEVGANGAANEVVTVRSQGNAGLELYGDTNNDGTGTAYLKLSGYAPGLAFNAFLGQIPVAGQNPVGVSYTGTLLGATLLGSNTGGFGLRTALQFGTDSNVRMTIAATGNVGIGITDPGTYRLNVQGGDVNFSGSLATGGTTRLDNAGNLTNIGNITGSSALTLASGGAGALTLDSASNVIQIAGSDTTIQRSAAGSFTLDLNDTATTTLAVTNSNAGAVANLSVEGSATAASFAGAGTNLTALDASNVTSGVLGDTYLSANVSLLNRDGQTFTGSNVFRNNSFELQNASSNKLLVADGANLTIKIGGGNVSPDANPVLLVLDSKSTDGDPSGVEGAMYYNNATKTFRCYADGAWSDCGVNQIDRGFLIEEDFLSGSNSTSSNAAAIGAANWRPSTIGTGSDFTYNPGDLPPSADRPGIFRIKTGNSVGDGAFIRLAGDGNPSMALSTGNVIKAAIAVADTANPSQVARVGAFGVDSATGRQNTGVWWEADPSQNANWTYCYGTGSAATCTASTVPISALSFARLEIRVTATGAGTSAATFIVNGNFYTVSGVTIDTATRVAPTFQCHSLSTATNRYCYIDYYRIQGTTTAPR